VLNELVVYHKCGNNILAAMRDKYFTRIKVTKDDDRGFEWIGLAPTENMIQDVQNRINEIGRKYMQEYLAKGKAEKKKPVLEFEFDNIENKKDDSVVAVNQNDWHQFGNLIEKLFGVRL
jgi:hypothetical protein